MDFSPESMRARFFVLLAERDRIRDQSGPLRKKRDEIESTARTQTDDIDAAVTSIEAQLPTIKSEMAIIARALGNKLT